MREESNLTKINTIDSKQDITSKSGFSREKLLNILNRIDAKLCSNPPDKYFLLSKRGEINHLLGNKKAAQADLQNKVSLLKQKDPGGIRAMYQSARNCFAREDYVTAEIAINVRDKCMSPTLDTFDYYEFSAKVYQKNAKFEEAIASCAKALSLDVTATDVGRISLLLQEIRKSSREYYESRGRDHQREGKYKEAMTDFTRALSLTVSDKDVARISLSLQGIQEAQSVITSTSSISSQADIINRLQSDPSLKVPSLTKSITSSRAKRPLSASLNASPSSLAHPIQPKENFRIEKKQKTSTETQKHPQALATSFNLFPSPMPRDDLFSNLATLASEAIKKWENNKPRQESETSSQAKRPLSSTLTTFTSSSTQPIQTNADSQVVKKQKTSAETQEKKPAITFVEGVRKYTLNLEQLEKEKIKRINEFETSSQVKRSSTETQERSVATLLEARRKYTLDLERLEKEKNQAVQESKVSSQIKRPLNSVPSMPFLNPIPLIRSNEHFPVPKEQKMSTETQQYVKKIPQKTSFSPYKKFYPSKLYSETTDDSLCMLDLKEDKSNSGSDSSDEQATFKPYFKN